MASKYDVEVRLSTVGATGMQDALKGVGSSAGTAEVSVTNLYSSLMKFQAAKFVIREVADAFMAFAKTGFDFNKQMESAQLGIQATLLTFRQYKDAANAGTNASLESANVLRLLQSEAFRTTGTMSQLIEGFQRLQAGASSSRASTQDIVRLTGTISNFASASGQQFNTLASQVNLALMGVSRSTGAFGAFLRSFGITPEILRSWQQAGTSVENVTKLLNEYMKLGPEINKTLAGVMSNVQDVVQQSSGAMMKPLTDSFKKVGTEFVNVMTESVGKGKDQITQLSDKTRTEAKVMGEILRLAFEVGVTALKRNNEELEKLFGGSRIDNLKMYAAEMAKLKYAIGEVVSGFMLLGRFATIGPSTDMMKLAKDSLDYITGMNARLKTAEAEYQKDIASIEKAAAVPMAASHGGVFESGGPKPPPPDEKALARIKELRREWEEFLKVMDAKVEMKGLTELDLQLAGIQKNFVQEVKQIEDAFVRLGKAAKPGDAARATQEMLKALDAVGKATDAAVEHERAKETDRTVKRIAKYQNAMDRLTSIEKTSLEDRIEAEITAAERSARIEHEKAIAASSSIGEMIDADEKYAAAEVSIQETVAARLRIIQLGRVGSYKAMGDLIAAEAKRAGDTQAEIDKKRREGVFAAELNNAKTLAEVNAAYARSQQKTDEEILAKRKAAWIQFLDEIKAANASASQDVLTQALSGNLSGESFKATMKQLTDASVASMSKLLSTYLEDVKIAGTSLNTWIGIAMQLGNALAGSWGNHQQSFKVAGQTYSQDFGGDSFGKQMAPYISAAVSIAVAGGFNLVSDIIAAVVLLVGAISALINGPQEGVVSLFTKVMGNNSAIGQAMMQTYGATYGAIAGINRAGGGSSFDLNKYMNDNMEGIKSWQIKLHAGSGEDLGKDAENFFKVVLPRIIIQQAFGQTWTGKYHSSVTDAGYAGTEGAPIMAPGSFDPSAPIPKMLAGLGMTAKMISGIARQIDLRAPDEFLTWLGRIVNVVTSFKTAAANLNKSWQQIAQDMAEGQKAGATTAFKTSTQTLIDLAGEIGNYVGDEQLTKMEELQKASDDYYNTALKAIQELIIQVGKIDAHAEDFVGRASQYYKNPNWLADDRTGRMAGASVAGETSAAGVQAAWDAFMKDAEDQLNYLIGLWQQAGAGMKTAAALATKFATIMTDAEAVTTVFTLWGDVIGLQTQYTNALKLSGQAQIDALAEINVSAAELYSSLLSIIQGINQAEGSIHKSIGQQIWENNYSVVGSDAGRRDMINAQITSLMGGIGSLSSAGDIQGSATEIQGLISRYLGMFSANDPHRAEAVAEANRALAALDAATHSRLEALRQQAEKDALEAKRIMDLTRNAFHDAQVSATAAIDALKVSVLAFKGEVDTKLLGWAGQITDQMRLASTALVTAMTTFTQALEGPATGTGTGGGGPKKGLQDLTTAANGSVLVLGDFTAAVKAATGALTGGKAA